NSGNHYAASAVNLLQQFIVNEGAAIFSGNQVRPSTRREADFDRTAAHGSSHGHDRVIFTDLAIFQLSNPDLIHAFGFEQANIFVAKDVTFGKQFAPAWPE